MQFHDSLHAIPFLGIMMTNSPKPRPLVTRIIEQSLPGVLVGVIVAMLTIWKSDGIQENDIKYNRERIIALEKGGNETRQLIDRKMESMSQELNYIRFLLEKYEQPKPKRP